MLLFILDNLLHWHYLQEKSLLTGAFFLLMGNSSILSSPSSETYSYSSRTGLALSSFTFCKEPNTLELVCGFSVFDLKETSHC